MFLPSDFEDWNKILEFLLICFDGLIQIHNENNGNTCLFLPPMSMKCFMDLDNNFNANVFCGRFAGFYYSSCISDFAKSMLSMLTTIYHFKNNSKNTTVVKYFKSIFTFFDYLINSDKRACESKNAIANGDILFHKVSV